MESVSQRELRNSSDELLRPDSRRGERADHEWGVPAVVLIPASSDARTRLLACGRLRAGSGLNLADLPEPVEPTRSSAELLDEDRSVRDSLRTNAEVAFEPFVSSDLGRTADL